jgi:transglycosylase-like protein
VRLVLLTLVLTVVVLACADSTSSSRGYLPPHQLWRAFLCVHRHEGAWTAHTGNGYYGGLQFDALFERTYGREFVRMWGHAHRWPPAVQMTVAMRAYERRGFGPWPATSRRCGLR